MWVDGWSVLDAKKTTTTPQLFYGPFSGTTGWAGARRELLNFMVQGNIKKGRHTDHLAGRHSIRTNQCPPPPPLPYSLQAGCLSCRPTNSVKALRCKAAFAATMAWRGTVHRNCVLISAACCIVFAASQWTSANKAQIIHSSRQPCLWRYKMITGSVFTKWKLVLILI